MTKTGLIIMLAALFFWQCRQNKETETAIKPVIMESTIQQTVDSLVKKYGIDQQERIARGVKLTASFWRNSDGNESDFRAFCRDNYIADTANLHKIFNRISDNFEVIFGYFNTISVDLQRPLQLDIGEILPVDERFGSYSPATHFTDDFFNNKIAFIISLNFPYFTLEEKNALAGKWNRKEWAYARLGDVFTSRVPADVNQNLVNALTRSDMYIADYNIFAGKLLDNNGKTLFPQGMKLLSHWNIRDEIKSNYGKENALEKQKLLYEVMKRIITQEIPVEVINSEKYTWNPYSNQVLLDNQKVASTPEKDRRYAILLDFFHAQQKIDPYYPGLNTYIKRNFESDMEIPLTDAEELFRQYLSSPQVKQVADVIKKRLGRNLEPFDIWYDGFKTRTAIPAEVLDKATRSKYPNRQAVQDDLPQILMKLGFDKSQALDITSKVQVDPARGSGHASGSLTREQKSLLRTRIFSNGMDYKGYNIAVHEFGHNVEQTISLHHVDYYMLHGIPNTAFTEALAFIFQKKDLQLLGMKDNNPNQQYLNNLDSFWSLYEIMGVSLVDIGTWKWLYDNPKATPSALRDAVNKIAVDVWNTYYAPVFGVKDQPILAIYSHMINTPLYLPYYVYGSIIQFQIEEYLKGKDFAKEIERIYSLGRLTPQQWMQQAVGSKISVQPIFKAVDEALIAVPSSVGPGARGN
jgi:hypothetical protein